MRIIDDDTVRAVLNMTDCVDAMRIAYRDLARNLAISHPRQRFKLGDQLDEPGYMANIIAGAVSTSGVSALRYDSMIVSEHVVGGTRRMEFQYPQRRSWGFVLLFSLATGEPLACIQDFSLSALRVGATTGVAVQALAKIGARSVGLFGSGKEAVRNLEGICAVRPIETVSVYSPNRQHREMFAAEMATLLGVHVAAVDSPAKAVVGHDVVMCATNSSEPVFDGALLEAGQLVCTIANSDHVHHRTEIDEKTFVDADVIVVNHLLSVRNNDQRELLDPIDAGRLNEAKIVELGNVLVGKSRGRTSERDIICYKANAGMGIQFAAACAVIYAACEERNLGHQVPTEWFGTDVGSWLDRGYLPSP